MGHQVFVVCPAIVATEESEEDSLQLFTEAKDGGRKNVEEEVGRLGLENPEYGQVGFVHGKLKAAEKQQAMQDFIDKRTNVLVATSVVEVGVDIPNATVLVVEGAECFGLAQLHQLRGRVGRGDSASFCFLCPSNPGQTDVKRLQVLVEESDGFKIAEADLGDRGPGDVRGLSQSGLPDFRMLRLTDLTFLEEVRTVVREYCEKYPSYVNEYS